MNWGGERDRGVSKLGVGGGGCGKKKVLNCDELEKVETKNI